MRAKVKPVAGPLPFPPCVSDGVAVVIAPEMVPCVLIVDDNPAILEVLEAFVGSRDYKVVVAGSAEAALRICDQVPVNVAVMDINLGGSDGLELLERIKAAHADLPVIMMTGMRPFEQWRKEAFLKGASGFVAKAESPEQLLIEIRRVLALEAEKRNGGP
ncbi:MAG: response regulator [Limisphaerales bacterium]